MLIARIAISLLIVLTGAVAYSDDVPRRQALILVNEDYEEPLEAPLVDGDIMSRALDSVGFELTLRQNLRDRKRMEEAIKRFTDDLEPDDVAVIYYSGHGHQFQGENYLVPVDYVQPSTSAEAAAQGVPMKFIVDALVRARPSLSILILDACRANPFGREDWDKGLARPAAVPNETVIMYPVGPGELTRDSANGSPFTKVFADELRVPGSDLDTVLQSTSKVLKDDLLPQPMIEERVSRAFHFREMVKVSFVFEYADDDAYLTLNGADILAARSQGSLPREVELRPGDNQLIVKVFNQKSWEGNNPLWGKPEGWNYRLNAFQEGRPVWAWQDGEGNVREGGGQFGDRFTVARVNLHVDRKTGALTFRARPEDLKLRP